MILSLLLLVASFELPAPVPVAPAAGAEIRTLPREVTFEWSPVPNAESYVLETDFMNLCAPGKWCSEVDESRKMIFRELVAPRYTAEYSFDQTIRWRVWAINGFLESERSPWRELSFKTTAAPTPPAAPKPLSPAVGVSLPRNVPVAFEWSPVAGAESYVLELDSWNTCAEGKWCSQLGKTQVFGSIKDTKYSLPLPNALQIKWRVRAVSGERKSYQSQWQLASFTPGSTPGAGSAAASSAVPSRMGGSGIPATMPVKIWGPQPEYTESARKERVSGDVLLGVTVGADGSVQDIHVVQSLREDLDANAMRTVKTWRFKPGTRDGKPAAVFAQISVSFNLL
jgi:TonB family protein